MRRGACKPTCAAGFADCDGNLNNGCETSVGTNCGGCGVVCGFPNAAASCATGSARWGPNPGWGNRVTCRATAARRTPTAAPPTVALAEPLQLHQRHAQLQRGACGITCNAGLAIATAFRPTVARSTSAPILPIAARHSVQLRQRLLPASAARTARGLQRRLRHRDGISSNGCESQLTTTTNCGSCGTACALPNA